MRKRSWKPKDKQIQGEDVEKAARVVNPEKARERTFARAVKLLAAKPRSVAELRERLLEKQWTNEEIVEAVLGKLGEYGYLNDERFAFGYASYKVRQKPVGRQRLQPSAPGCTRTGHAAGPVHHRARVAIALDSTRRTTLNAMSACTNRRPAHRTIRTDAPAFLRYPIQVMPARSASARQTRRP